MHFIEVAPSILREIPWLGFVEHKVSTVKVRRQNLISSCYIIVTGRVEINGSHFIVDFLEDQIYLLCTLNLVLNLNGV